MNEDRNDRCQGGSAGILPAGRGRPARAARHGRDGHGIKNVAPGMADYAVPGRAQFPTSVIGRIET